MNAGYLTLTIDQGADYSQVMQYAERTNEQECPTEAKPVDIRGWTAKMQIRRAIGQPVVIELTETSGIEIEPAPNGIFTIAITKAQTMLLTAESYMYDLFFTRPDNTTEKVLYGSIIVNKAVTL